MADLHVFMAGRRMGVLEGHDRRNLRVTYDESWIEDPVATPLSVSMPLGARHHSGKVVEPYLWGLLPDNDRVLARWAADHQCSASDVFALLEHVGADVAGAAQYLPPATTADEAATGQLHPLTEADVAVLLHTVREDATAWHPRPVLGRWSLAGAQAKIALAYDQSSCSWAIPSGSIPTTHILKPAITGLDGHDLNEHLCLAAAARLGLTVADTRVARLGDERALVIRRYDRTTLPNGRIVRVHQEDFCQALSIHPSKKYQSDGGPGVERMADLLRVVVPDRPSDEIAALCRAVAFNWLVLGTDAHAKNYSLLLSGQQVRLAPLYDIASAVPYGDHPKKLRMAQKIGGEYRVALIERRHWERLARAAAADPDALVQDIQRMIDHLPDALSDAIGASELDERESSLASGLLDGVDDWLSHCRSAMRTRGSST